jgi:hypothetical protein
MAVRTWTEGDPEPKDHPPIVDNEDVTWLWVEIEEDWWEYQRQYFEHRGLIVLGGPIGLDWEDIVGEYGPLREATAEEAENLTVSFKSTPDQP